MTPSTLRRDADTAWTAPPPRIIHLGLGAFARAHLAWYTQHAGDRGDWGIVGFTNHSNALPRALGAQEGLYTLTTRGPHGDDIAVMTNLVAAHSGDDTATLEALAADPNVAIITFSVTEAGYATGGESIAPRLADLLAARHRHDGGPITLVSCDNLGDNASALHRVLDAVTRGRDDAFASWIEASVRVVGSVVDCITPAATNADRARVVDAGWFDAAPVVSEPYREWIIGAPLPGAHPDWVGAGARLTEDLGPFARRKLHLLNAAHSLLAYQGGLRGHRTVHEAMHDPGCATSVQAWWDEADEWVGGDDAESTNYRRSVTERFVNHRIDHRLDQIAVDGSLKLRERVLPVVRHERDRGRAATASASILGAWICWWASGHGVADAQRARVRAALEGAPMQRVRRMVGVLDDALSDDEEFCANVSEHARRFASLAAADRPQ